MILVPIILSVVVLIWAGGFENRQARSIVRWLVAGFWIAALLYLGSRAFS
jgi:hypothetical protein